MLTSALDRNVLPDDLGLARCWIDGDSQVHLHHKVVRYFGPALTDKQDTDRVLDYDRAVPLLLSLEFVRLVEYVLRAAGTRALPMSGVVKVEVRVSALANAFGDDQVELAPDAERLTPAIGVVDLEGDLSAKYHCKGGPVERGLRQRGWLLAGRQWSSEKQDITELVEDGHKRLGF